MASEAKREKQSQAEVDSSFQAIEYEKCHVKVKVITPSGAIRRHPTPCGCYSGRDRLVALTQNDTVLMSLTLTHPSRCCRRSLKQLHYEISFPVNTCELYLDIIIISLCC